MQHILQDTNIKCQLVCRKIKEVQQSQEYEVYYLLHHFGGYDIDNDDNRIDEHV